MSQRNDRDQAPPCYRDYVIKNGKFVGRFEEMYRDVPDPWGCLEKVNSLPNRLFLALLQEGGPYRKVLDIGCGLGPLTRSIFDIGCPAEMLACDMSETAVAKARQSVPGVEFFVHDLVRAPRLPFENSSFALITASEITWYVLPVLEDLLAELRRLLTPEGHLLWKQSFLAPGKQQYGREIISNPEDLRKRIQAAGLSIGKDLVLTEMSGEINYVARACPCTREEV